MSSSFINRIHLCVQDEDNGTSSLQCENLVGSETGNYESNDCDLKTESKSSIGITVKTPKNNLNENEANSRNGLDSPMTVDLKNLTVDRVHTLIFLNNKALVNSSGVDNPLEKYSCSSCKYKTADKAYLEQHMATHSSDICCKLCHFKSKDKETSKSHLLTHAVELSISGTRPQAVKVRVIVKKMFLS